jgi:hypothetical protein
MHYKNFIGMMMFNNQQKTRGERGFFVTGAGHIAIDHSWASRNTQVSAHRYSCIAFATSAA